MRPRTLLGPIIAVLLSAGPAAAEEWRVDRSAANRAAFTARFMGETFDGATSRIDGYVFWKAADPGTGALLGSDLYFEVDLNALGTGIGLRDHHMREDYLETGRHPYATFKGTVRKLAREEGGGVLATVEGKLSLHGRDRPLSVTGRVTVEGERARFTCTFPLDIRDYGIKVPSLMGAKVDPAMVVDLGVTLLHAKSPDRRVP